MPDEKAAPLPLNGDEVKEAILFKINESLNRTCHLIHDSAYTSFRAKVTISLELNDFGRIQPDNHIVTAEEDSGLASQGQMRQVDANLTIDPQPPNQLRVDTDQPVPVRSTENGKTVVRNIRYTPRKKA